MKFIDLTGQKFSRLTVIGFHQTVNRRIKWRAVCDCGISIMAGACELRSGNTKSCGCLQRQRTSEAAKTHGVSWKVPEYNVWVGMGQRCNNPKNSAYKNYGARGITVCPRWDSFIRFYEDMGSRPSPNHSIERKDNNKGYYPDNCEWAINIDQCNNTRKNRWLDHDGKRMTVSQWNRFLNLPKGTVQGRLHLGWSIQEALTPKLLRKHV